MTWQEVTDQVMNEKENFPSSIHPVDKARYLRLEIEARFNDIHHINQDYNELIKNHKFAIIKDCLSRHKGDKP